MANPAWRYRPVTQRLGPLYEREFRLLYLARAFSLFGDGLIPVALPFAVFSIDRSPSALGFVLASRSISLVVFLLVAGVVADRLARKVVMIASDIARLAAQATMAALLIGGAAKLWQLVSLVFLYGLGDAFFRPTSTGFVPETVSRARLQQANALLVLTNSSFSILGPVVAGVLVASVGPGWALAADAATFLASALFLVQIHVVPKARPLAASFLRELREGWQVFRSQTWLWVDGVFSALGSFAVLAPMFVLGPVVAVRSLGGAPAWATIVAAFGAGSILAGVVLLRARPRRPLLVAIPPLALLALPTAFLALPAPTLIIALGALAGGFGLTVFNTLFETTVQRHVPPESLSRVASIDWVMSGALQPFGFALAGSAALVVGLGTTLAASALWIIISTAIVLSIPSVRNLRSPDQ
ncbi:MAG: MFS transporter [Chloroflexi bacterium]|nr:MAG: MFS transporter [Chloroflexota bacterium]